MSAVRGRCSRVRVGGASVKSGSRKVLRGETAVAPVFRGKLIVGMDAGGARRPRWIGGAGGIDVGGTEGDGFLGRVEMRCRMATGSAGEVRRDMGVRIVAGCVGWNRTISDRRRSY